MIYRLNSNRSQRGDSIGVVGGGGELIPGQSVLAGPKKRGLEGGAGAGIGCALSHCIPVNRLTDSTENITVHLITYRGGENYKSS